MRCPPQQATQDGELGVLPVFDLQGGRGKGGIQDQADLSNGWLSYGNPCLEMTQPLKRMDVYTQLM